jgi:ABC-2 type transport system ATP-binding protein
LFRSFYCRGLTPEEALALVGLTAKTSSYVGRLSGGQRQRLAVACALVGQPDLLFLDEPTTGLDPQARRELWNVLRQFREHGGAILLTTHAMDEAEQVCDRVAIVDHGRVICSGRPAELIARSEGGHVIEFAVAGRGALDQGLLAHLPGVATVAAAADSYRLGVSAPPETLPALLALLQQHGFALTRVSVRHGSLEDLFLALTGRHWPAASTEGM